MRTKACSDTLPTSLPAPQDLHTGVEDPTPLGAPFAITPAGSVLDTARFTLTPVAEADRDELFAHLADPETVAYMDIDPLSDPTGADAIIAWAAVLTRARMTSGSAAATHG